MREKMGPYESIDDLVDEILNKSKEIDKEIGKRKIKPFRYLTNRKEIESALSEEEKQITFMKNPKKKELFNEEIFKVGMGDVKTIEDIIKKHQVSRRIK
jgi:hypothetical protein